MDLLNKLKVQGWYLTEDGLNKIRNEASATHNSNELDVRKIIAIASQIDFREIAAGALPVKREDSIPGRIVLQLQKTRNISAPKSNEESKTSPRFLQLDLSDGQTTVQALEMEHVPALNLNLAPGTKIFLCAERLQLMQGFIVLHSNDVQVLGGRVEALAEKWEVARQMQIYARSGQRNLGTSGPPPWIPFGSKIDAQAEALPTDRNFKSLQAALEKDTNKDNEEFKAMRTEAIAEAAKGGTKKIFGGGGQQLLDHNTKKILEKGYSEGEAKHALRSTNNNLERALFNLKRRRESGRAAAGSEQTRNSVQNSSLTVSSAGRIAGNQLSSTHVGSSGTISSKRTSNSNNIASAKDELAAAKPAANVQLFDFLTEKLPTQTPASTVITTSTVTTRGNSSTYINPFSKMEKLKTSDETDRKVGNNINTRNSRFENNLSSSFDEKRYGRTVGGAAGSRGGRGDARNNNNVGDNRIDGRRNSFDRSSSGRFSGPPRGFEGGTRGGRAKRGGGRSGGEERGRVREEYVGIRTERGRGREDRGLGRNVRGRGRDEHGIGRNEHGGSREDRAGSRSSLAYQPKNSDINGSGFSASRSSVPNSNVNHNQNNRSNRSSHERSIVPTNAPSTRMPQNNRGNHTGANNEDNDSGKQRERSGSFNEKIRFNQRGDNNSKNNNASRNFTNNATTYNTASANGGNNNFKQTNYSSGLEEIIDITAKLQIDSKRNITEQGSKSVGNEAEGYQSSRQPQKLQSSSQQYSHKPNSSQRQNSSIQQLPNGFKYDPSKIIGFQSKETNDFAMSMLKNQGLAEINPTPPTTPPNQSVSKSTANVSPISANSNSLPDGVGLNVQQQSTSASTNNPQLLTTSSNKLSVISGEIWPWKVGEKCLAKYWDDGRFYEAEITAIAEKTCVVFYIGYGNYEEVLKSDCLAITSSPQQQLNNSNQQIPHNIGGTSMSSMSNVFQQPQQHPSQLQSRRNSGGSQRYRTERQMYVPPHKREN